MIVLNALARENGICFRSSEITLIIIHSRQIFSLLVFDTALVILDITEW